MAGVSPGELADQFEVVGTWGLRLEAGKALGAGQVTELPEANEDFRGLEVVVVGGEGAADQKYFCRKNADDTYEWIPLGVSVATVVLYRLQSFDESTSPADLASSPHDADADGGTVNLQPYRQGRIRATVDDDPGTADVVGEVQYSSDGGNVYTALLTNVFDFGDASTTTEWEDLPSAVLASDVYVYLKVVVTGTGSANVTASVYLDLRG